MPVQLSSTTRFPSAKATTRQSAEPRQAPASADRVREMLLELAYAMHATRVVGWKGGIAPKKG